MTSATGHPSHTRRWQETQETQETHDNDNDDDNNADAGTWDLEAAMLQYAWAATAIIGSY